MLPPARVIYSCVFFALVLTLIMLTKPALFFSEDGRHVRPFGLVGVDGAESPSVVAPTPVPLGAAVVLIAVGSMLLFGTIDVIYRAAAPASYALPPPTTTQYQQQHWM